MMKDTMKSEQMSMLLSTYLERTYTGRKEEVEIVRRALDLYECLNNSDKNSIYGIQGGSLAEGLCMMGSDVDEMIVSRDVVVMHLDQCIPSNMEHKTILFIREADCRPGFVRLQLGQLGLNCDHIIFCSLVTVGTTFFISSDLYREQYVSYLTDNTGWIHESNGPSCSTTSTSHDSDSVPCFQCTTWPKEAKEWETRQRVHGWPCQTLIDKIVQSGCHLVPVGDKCSPSTLLQWRISFAVAEKLLIHSFTYLQLKVYTLLKYFLKQIKSTLKENIGDDDILCSYFLKTTLFHAIENTSQMFWQDKNLFDCFWFCFNILITWVKAGFCPHYFVQTNNLFKRKVHGQHQQILLNVLKTYSKMKWKCLSVGDYYIPSIWKALCNTSTQAKLVCPETAQEVALHRDTTSIYFLRSAVVLTTTLRTIKKAFQLLSTSQSDFDEVYTYHYATMSLQRLAASKVYSGTADAPNNKTRYRKLRKCKHWMTPSAVMGTELLNLATFHFLTGNCSKCLKMCKQVNKLASYYVSNLLHNTSKSLHPEQEVIHRHEFNPSEQALDKLRKFYSNLMMFDGSDFSLPHLCLEQQEGAPFMIIPPLPYALFLTFLCCQELGDTRGRDEALQNLIQIQYDDIQGGEQFWIVHTLLGLCYQTLGDYHRAIRAYWKSEQSKSDCYEWNPAINRIAIVYLCLYISHRSDRG
ncbi:uncharacterized protein LOC132558217 [Ylistrum balloti]|uniref:uncharacterized protein LOC132558217 n=1 Tax=Ylistrum balloti TaxID=509963 RepID=UPI002905F213|nr:uncharacterized protein LOC132558217 [Ylistrum balloti]